MSKANQDTPLNCLDPISISGVPTQTFSMELQTCRITDKGIDLQVVKVDHVLSYLCVCSECWRGFPAKSSLMVHRQIEHHENPISTELTTDTKRTPDNELTFVKKHPASSIQPTVGVDNSKAGRMPSKQSARIQARNNVVQDGDKPEGLGSKSDHAIDPSIAKVKAKRNRPKRNTRKTTSPAAEAAGNGVPIPDNVAGVENAAISDHPATNSLADHAYQKNEVQPGDWDGLTSRADDISEDHELSNCEDATTSSTSPRRKNGVKKSVHGSASEDICKIRNAGVEKTRRKKKERQPAQCNTCGKTFMSRQHFLDHQNVHLGLKPYICTLCDKTFAYKNRLRNHVWMHKTDGGIPCEICGKCSSSHAALKLHMSVHTGAKPHQCNVCGKLFGRQGNLTVHMRIHTGEKPYACTVCGKSFTQASILRDHQATHNNAQFLCPHCGKQFKQRSCLGMHVRVQHEGKPVTCTICGKVFKEERYLKMHYKSHEKPHSCSICGKRYCRRFKLINHMKKQHTGDTPFKCTRCDQTFESLDNLKTHLYETHKESSNKIQSAEIESSIVRHFEDGLSSEIECSIVRHFEDGQSAEIETSIVQHLVDCLKPDVDNDDELIRAVRIVEDSAT